MMNKDTNQTEIPFDSEWLELILMAKELGLQPEEIRAFLNESNPKFAAS